MRAVRAIALTPFHVAAAARDILGYQRLPVDEPGMAAWLATVLEDIARFGKP
jgi:hypothetical protein